MRKKKVPSSKMTERSSVCGELNVSKMIANRIPLQVNSLNSCFVINGLMWFHFCVQLQNKQVLCVDAYSTIPDEDFTNDCDSCV